MSQPQITAEDAVQVAQRALQKVNELETEVDKLQSENETLRSRVEELEASQPDPDEYDQLDRPDKVGLLKRHLITKASDTNGKAAADYKEVKYGVFDGQPSADHCYTLMKQAAQDTAFTFQNPSNSNKRITVNTNRRKTNTEFSHANKDS